MTADKLWTTALDAIRQQVSAAHFSAWYAPVRLLDAETVDAPTPTTPTTSIAPPALAALAALAATATVPPPATATSRLVFLLAVGSNYAANLLSDELQGKIGHTAAAAVASTDSVARDPALISFRVLVRADLFNTAIPPSSTSAAPATAHPASAPVLPAAAAPGEPAFAPPHERTLKLSSLENVFQVSLAARYELADFVVSPENNFAHQGVKMVIERPGARFSSLFLHGPPGTGKTHLLQGACLALHRRNSHLRVLYLSCEQWVNGYLEHTKNHRLDLFRRAVRSVDVLAIDDLHFLIGKKGSQREFLFMLEALQMNGRQLIVSSNLPPAQLKMLDARLLERFYSSLVCPLEKPGEPLREAIAAQQFKRHTTGVTREALQMIGRQPSPSLHELEGRINLLLAKSGGATVGLNDCKAWLGLGANDGEQGVLFVMRRARPVAIGRILEQTAAFFHILPEDIRGRRRSQSVLLARVVACKLARDLSGKSLQEIGRQLGDRSHATVLHCLRRFDVRRGVDADLAQAYRQLSEALSGPQA